MSDAEEIDRLRALLHQARDVLNDLWPTVPQFPYTDRIEADAKRCVSAIDHELGDSASSGGFYILSLTHSDWQEHLIWYRSECSGYAERLDWAGIYTAVEIDAGKITDGEHAVAIPVSAVRSRAVQVVVGGERRSLLAVQRRSL